MSEAAAETKDGGNDGGGFLGWIEKVGNKVPHPALIFLGLIVGVILLSAVLAWADVSVTTEVAEPVPSAVVPDYSDAGSSYPSYEHEPDPTIPDYEMVKRVPRPTSVFKVNMPPSPWTVFFTTAMPTPRPLARSASSRVEKPGHKIRSSSAASSRLVLSGYQPPSCAPVAQLARDQTPHRLQFQSRPFQPQ